MKRILCFGDSLTWGFDPATRTRFDEDSRWPCVMQQALGGDYKVIEEGTDFYRITLEDDSTLGLAYKDIVTPSAEGTNFSFDFI